MSSHLNEPCHTYDRGVSHTALSHVTHMIQSKLRWLRLVGSLKLQVSFAEYRLFYRALLQKRPIILRRLLHVAHTWSSQSSVTSSLLNESYIISLYQLLMSHILYHCILHYITRLHIYYTTTYHLLYYCVIYYSYIIQQYHLQLCHILYHCILYYITRLHYVCDMTVIYVIQLMSHMIQLMSYNTANVTYDSANVTYDSANVIYVIQLM